MDAYMDLEEPIRDLAREATTLTLCADPANKALIRDANRYVSVVPSYSPSTFGYQ